MEFEDVLTTERQAIGTEEVAKAQQLLEKYKAGKAALDQRIIENEQWFRMQHWRSYKNNMMEGKPKPASGWLFNSIANKHADAMDNYPEPNILPRAADDEETAKVLSKIFPVLLEQADYEEVYSDTWWRKLKQGTGVKGVFWDPALRGGVGDIAIKSMDLLMLYWEPGVTDIQDSPNLFSLALANNDQLAAQWPQLEGHTGGSLTTSKYIHDESIDTSDKSVVVDWYYKKAVGEGRTVLHYCKFCNGVVLYASENDPEYAERGFYDHGKCTIIGIVGGAIATAFGGWDTALAALVTFMAIDYITGLMVAGIFHTSPKTESGALESLAGWKGLCRKGVTLLVVLVACQLDKVMGSSFIRDAAIIGFMANEAISIIENAGLMGVPIPETITQAVDVLRKKGKEEQK